MILIRVCLVWPYVASYGLIWHCMALCGLIWSFCFSLPWPCVSPSNLALPKALCDLVWSCTAFYGLIWHFMVFSRGHRSKFILSCLPRIMAGEWRVETEQFSVLFRAVISTELRLENFYFPFGDIYTLHTIFAALKFM